MYLTFDCTLTFNIRIIVLYWYHGFIETVVNIFSHIVLINNLNSISCSRVENISHKMIQCII